MNNQSKENLVNDIENRLDAFFSEDTESPNPPGSQTLERLKSLVLSIDWEITEECLNDMVEEAGTLMSRFRDDRFTTTLLRMLKAVGSYMNKRKARSHPDAIKRIMSVFASLEQLTSEDQLEDDLKKRIVAKEIAAFKKLKEQVEVQRKVPVVQEETAEPQEAGAAFVERSKFEQAMSAVEERLNSQVTALKAQLKALQDELDNMRRG